MAAARVLSLAILLALAVGLDPTSPGSPGSRQVAGGVVAAAPMTATPTVRSGPATGAEPGPTDGQPSVGDAPPPRTEPWVDLPALPPDAFPEDPPTSAAAGPAPVTDVAAAGIPPTAPACEPAPQDLRPAPFVRTGPRTGRSVALTFDDGWNPENTLRILRTLQNSGVNATFFPLGTAIKASPSTWRAVVAAGYPLADHTQDHATLKGKCYQTQLAELSRWQSTARRLLGVAPLPVMRPPGGAFDRTTRLAAAGAGEAALVLWDIDTRDWAGLTSRAIVSRALAAEPGSIVLLHTQPTSTVTALPSIIAAYRARGFRFVTVGTLLGLGGPVPFA